MSDDDFFGSPPPATSGSADYDEEPAIILGVPPEETYEEPIVLGGPSPDDYAAAPDADAPMAHDAFATAPSYENHGSMDDNEPTIGGPEAGAEPTPMQKWNQEWQQTLLERKEEENQKKSSLIEKAKLDLENFAKEREMKRDTKMAKNREDEQAKLEAIEADLENDNSWQKVCKLVELSHDSKDKAEDTKRMRDILIHLKNDAPKAEALI